MKKIIFLLLTMIPLLAFCQKAKISFGTTSHNFGTISENGGKATVDFEFTNTGDSPLILNNVRAGCGCTTPEWSKQPVAPGASGKVSVSYDPINRPGAFIKSVTVNSNAENAVINLTIRGNVSRKPMSPYDNYKHNIGQVKAVSGNINLGAIRNTSVLERSMEIINSGDQPVSVSVINPNKHITATVTPAVLNKDQKGVIRIVYDAAKKNDWDFVSDQIKLKAGQQEGEILITATINEDFSKYDTGSAPVAEFSEQETKLENLAKNSTQVHEFFIQNNGHSDLIIRKLKPSDENISVSVAKSIIKPGKKAKATVTVKTGDRSGKALKIVRFTLNDPQNPVVIYKTTINVL